MKKPKGLDSGLALRSKNKKRAYTAVEKIDLVVNMTRRVETCPTCGHEEETGFITPEEARKLLGFD